MLNQERGRERGIKGELEEEGKEGDKVNTVYVYAH